MVKGENGRFFWVYVPIFMSCELSPQTIFLVAQCLLDFGNTDCEIVYRRKESGMPDTADQRKKWFLKKGGQAENWVWEEGRLIHGDFFNPYLDFNSEFVVRARGIEV